jgi:phytoene desaturase
VLFLGTAPENTPAMYSLMAYSGIKKGTFYPMGGFGSVIDGFVKLNKELGVKFHSNEEVFKLNVKGNKIKTISTNKSAYNFDIVVGSADYNHVDSNLIDKKYSNYNNSYWQKKIFSPSCLLFYLGVDKKINKLDHHNLFFDEDINNHIDDIYKAEIWPKKPLFYTCCPSKTDSSVAPKGKENLFVLMPIPSGVKDNNETREKYFKILINRLEKYIGEPIKQNIEYKRSYCVNDFIEDYHAYKGNAYGLANTLNQTANLKPKIINKKIKNLYYTGQLTVPGPGVPPSIISGQVVAEYINKMNK